MKINHHLALASIVLVTEVIRFATKLVVLLGMIYNYFLTYAANVGLKIRA